MNSATNLRELPMMPLRDVVMFPGAIIPLFVGRESSITAIEQAVSKYERNIILVTQKDPDQEKPQPDDLYEMGVVSKILQLMRMPDGSIKVLFEGLYRAKWISSSSNEEMPYGELPYPCLIAEEIIEIEEKNNEALLRAVHEAVEEFGVNNRKISSEHIAAISGYHDLGRLADSIMPHLKLDFAQKQAVLEILEPTVRLEQVYEYLSAEISVSVLEKGIKSRVKGQMERNQREYYLAEQIKAIHKEMGQEDPLVEMDELEARFKEKDMTEEATEKGMRELRKLRQMSPSSAEYTVARNYLDWILDLPWGKTKEIDIDIDEARRLLDNAHFGLEKPKERILEYLAVQKLTNALKGPILCFVGPPGVGKTSLAKSVAEATCREFVRISLGGVRDEAEIRGHRRTYVGAMPGKIIMALKKAKYNNPLFCLDEIDKMSADFRGDPASALLEVLDPEQNNTFSDHYLDLDYDLSKVFFITTANSLQDIPIPLRDRMEIIELSSYLETEKIHIARDFLIQKQTKEHGLEMKNLSISDNALVEIIRSYTREAGVRSLEREIARLCRKTAIAMVDKKNPIKRMQVTLQKLPNLLGIKKYRFGEREDKDQIGVITGLAYSSSGGDILYIETAVIPGSGKIFTTGQLGDVMTESAKAAFTYIRSRASMFGLKPDFYKEIDIHVHVPEGATPKDGPSAGITLATSMVSALLGIPARNDLAMTGEITLRGRVLPIGGLREKLLAARRAGIKTVIVPAENEKDLKDVPSEILKSLEIRLVSCVDEVLLIAFNAEAGDFFACKHPNTDLTASLQEKPKTETKQKNSSMVKQ